MSLFPKEQVCFHLKYTAALCERVCLDKLQEGVFCIPEAMVV